MEPLNSHQTKENSNKKTETKPSGDISRRKFIATGATAMAAPLFIPRSVLGGKGYKAPSDKLRIAAVGLNMGFGYLKGCSDEHIVALCDLDHNGAARAFNAWPKANRYHDFRKMLDKEANNIDGIIVATPDHTHTIILMAAIDLNKHIYCAKPITHNIGEARRVRQALAENPQLVTKSSVQSSGTSKARSTTELLKSGVIGPITEVHIWTDHPIYPAGLSRPTKKETPPQGMDWDLWIGPAPFRPYSSAYHPWNWRPWWDFGTGTVGDMCCHTLHAYFNELDLRTPTAIYAEGSTRYDDKIKKIETPECQSRANLVTWEYSARGAQPPVNVYWYDGGMKPHRPAELDHDLKMPNSGVLFVGEKGKLLSGYGGGNRFEDRGISGGLLLPEKKFIGYQDPPETMRRVDEHYKEWTEACKTGAKTVCPIEFGCEMTELGLLGGIALRTGKLLKWDSQNMKITNHGDDVNQLIDPPYRKGWEI